MNLHEYQSFKAQFHCVTMSDECYSGPFSVETADGIGNWMVYVDGAQFHAACEWLNWFRLSGNRALHMTA